MAGTPEQARINGLKGGRPKAAHTIQAEEGKKALIKAYLDNIVPINEALVNKAKSGDIQAIKELHDRVHGRAAQDVKVSGDIEMHIIAIDE